MPRALGPFVACLVLSAAAVAAQEKPNFVGTWKLVDQPPPQFAPSVISVTRDDSVLTIVNSGQMGEIRTTYKLDGTEGRSPFDFNGTTIDRVTQMTWDGDKMILVAKSEMNGQIVEFKSVWSLGADGTLLTQTTFPDFQGGGAPITMKASYKKS